MADISIQFYAAEEELANWLQGWASTDGITLVSMRYQPFQIEKVPLDAIVTTLSDVAVRRLILFAIDVNLDVQSKLEFERSNANGLVLDVGHLLKEGLCESWLACRTENALCLGKWREVAKDLKSKTIKGVTATNRQNGVSAFYKSVRYSPGAASLEAAGVAMIPIQGIGGPIIRLGNTT